MQRFLFTRQQWQKAAALHLALRQGLNASDVREGGQHVYTSAIEANIVDKYAIFIAPKLLGGRDSFTLFSGEGVANLALAHHLKDVQVTQLGNDVLIEGYSKKEN